MKERGGVCAQVAALHVDAHYIHMAEDELHEYYFLVSTLLGNAFNAKHTQYMVALHSLGRNCTHLD